MADEVDDGHQISSSSQPGRMPGGTPGSMYHSVPKATAKASAGIASIIPTSEVWLAWAASGLGLAQLVITIGVSFRRVRYARRYFELHGQGQGFVLQALTGRDEGELFRHCFEMGRVMVRSERQRLGHGAAIVQRLLAEAKRRKVEIIWLDVRMTNVPAIELFQKLGFRTWGIFPDRIKAGREYLDVLYMACDLRQAYHPLRDLP